MSRELWKNEMEAALLAVKAMEELQKSLPDGYYFDGHIKLVLEGGVTLGKIAPNDVDEFTYEPVEES